MKAIIVLLAFVLSSCSYFEKDKKPVPPQPDPTIEDVRAAQELRRVEALEIMGRHDSGWLAPNSCDGALWSFKGAAAFCPSSFNARASEFEGQRGRYGRRPPPACWQRGREENDSKTTWSGDMAKGLMAYAWRCKDLSLLLDHEEYGRANAWRMGEGDTGAVLARAQYRPGLIGELYSVIWGLGGPDNANRLWPNTFPSGQTDFHAHLQMMSIWLMGEVAEHMNSADAVPKPPPGEAFRLAGAGAIEPEYSLLDVSEVMYERIVEHFERDPRDPFFAAVYGVYTGDYAPALALCAKVKLDYYGEYVRCKDTRACQLAHHLHACDIVERRFKAHAL